MPKIDLIPVKGSSYFCSGRLSIGVYITNKVAILIDSGIDTDTAKAIDKAIIAMGCSVGTIINTHSHADHCGGNKYFQDKYKNLKIFSTRFERHFIEDTYQEPSCFCGGAAPFAELRNKHLEAQPSQVTNVIHPYKDQPIEIEGVQFDIVTLPGHTNGMIGVITPDNVFYCGDAIFGEETFSKHGVLFYTNIADTLATLKKMANFIVDACVFYHGGATNKSMVVIAEQHTQKILETMNIIYNAIEAQTHSIESLTQFTMKQFQIPENVMQYTLTQTCVRAYVTQLQKEGKIDLSIKDGLMHVTSKIAPQKKSEESANSETVSNGRVPTLEHLSDFKVYEGEDDNADQVVVAFQLKELKLTGEMHSDATILNSLEFLLSDLKFKNLIKDTAILVQGDAQPQSNYHGVQLKYNPGFLGKMSNNTSVKEELLKVKLYTDHFEFILDKTFKNSPKLQAISAELERLGIARLHLDAPRPGCRLG